MPQAVSQGAEMADPAINKATVSSVAQIEAIKSDHDVGFFAKALNQTIKLGTLAAFKAWVLDGVSGGGGASETTSNGVVIRYFGANAPTATSTAGAVVITSNGSTIESVAFDESASGANLTLTVAGETRMPVFTVVDKSSNPWVRKVAANYEIDSSANGSCTFAGLTNNAEHRFNVLYR